MLKDSGAIREFRTGAVRDIAEGKGRCDLLPLCGDSLWQNRDESNYCFRCGQAIDWSDEP